MLEKIVKSGSLVIIHIIILFALIKLPYQNNPNRTQEIFYVFVGLAGIDLILAIFFFYKKNWLPAVISLVMIILIYFAAMSE